MVGAYSALAGEWCSFCLMPTSPTKPSVTVELSQAQKIVKAFYTGEAVKLVLTATLFTVVFVSIKPLDILALFVSYF